MRTRFMDRRMILGAALAAACAAVPAGAEEGAAAAKSAAPLETPKTVEFAGVSIGMSLAEVAWTLEANGYRPSPNHQRRYIDDSGDAKRRIRYRELPAPDDTLTIYELDETVWYPAGTFDGKAYEAELRKRFGAPTQVNDRSVGLRELVYGETGPSVIEVIAACQKEIQEKDPKLSADEAEARASAAAQYRADNDQVTKICPGAEPLYRKMADTLEAPRLTIVMRSARVDSMVRWPWVEAELVRRLGPDQAAKVVAFGPDAMKPASPPAPKP